MASLYYRPIPTVKSLLVDHLNSFGSKTTKKKNTLEVGGPVASQGNGNYKVVRAAYQPPRLYDRGAARESKLSGEAGSARMEGWERGGKLYTRWEPRGELRWEQPTGGGIYGTPSQTPMSALRQPQGQSAPAPYGMQQFHDLAPSQTPTGLPFGLTTLGEHYSPLRQARGNPQYKLPTPNDARFRPRQ